MGVQVVAVGRGGSLEGHTSLSPARPSPRWCEQTRVVAGATRSVLLFLQSQLGKCSPQLGDYVLASIYSRCSTADQRQVFLSSQRGYRPIHDLHLMALTFSEPGICRPFIGRCYQPHADGNHGQTRASWTPLEHPG